MYVGTHTPYAGLPLRIILLCKQDSCSRNMFLFSDSCVIPKDNFIYNFSFSPLLLPPFLFFDTFLCTELATELRHGSHLSIFPLYCTVSGTPSKPVSVRLFLTWMLEDKFTSRLLYWHRVTQQRHFSGSVADAQLLYHCQLKNLEFFLFTKEETRHIA